MTWNIISLIYPILFLLIAGCCYKKEGKHMQSFYIRMTYHDLARRFYVLMVMLVLIVFLYIHSRSTGNVMETFIPLLLTVLLIRHRLSEEIFYLLKKRRLMIAFTSLTLLAAITPGMFATSVTCSIYLMASIFYPSRKVRDMVEGPQALPLLTQGRLEIIQSYY